MMHKLLIFDKKVQYLFKLCILIYRWLQIKPSLSELEFLSTQSKWYKYHPRFFVLLLKEFYYLFNRHELLNKASALTYSTIVAAGPLIAVILFFSIAFGSFDTINEQILSIVNNHFSSIVAIDISNYLTNIFINIKNSTEKSALGPVAIATFLFTVIKLIWNIEASFHKIFDIQTSRFLLKKVFNYITILLLIPFLGTLSSKMLFAKLSESYFSPDIQVVIKNIYSVISFFITSFEFAILYYILPGKKIYIRSVLIGGFVSSFLFLYLQILNNYLTERALSARDSINLYGMAPVILVAFFVWLNLIWLILLIGATFTAAMSNIQEMIKPEKISRIPFSDILYCTDVFSFVADFYMKNSQGISIFDLLRDVKIPETDADFWLNWFVKRKLFISATVDGVLKFFPTHKALELYNNSEQFVNKLVFFGMSRTTVSQEQLDYEQNLTSHVKYSTSFTKEVVQKFTHAIETHI